MAKQRGNLRGDSIECTTLTLVHKIIVTSGYDYDIIKLDVSAASGTSYLDFQAIYLLLEKDKPVVAVIDIA